MAMGVKGDIEYLKDDTSEGGSRTLGSTAAVSSLGSSGADLAKKGVQKGMTKLADKILTGTPKPGLNITSVTKLGKLAKGMGMVASGAAGVASVASFGKQVYDEAKLSSSLNTGRGFESSGNKLARAGQLGAGAVGTVAAIGTAIGTITSTVATTNFWNPIGWIAAGVGVVAAGIGYLANKSKIGGLGRGNFLSKYKPGKIAGRR
jgi:hypothetical protein